MADVYDPTQAQAVSTPPPTTGGGGFMSGVGDFLSGLLGVIGQGGQGLASVMQHVPIPLVSMAGYFPEHMANVLQMGTDKARLLHSLLANDPRYLSTIMSGADSGGAGGGFLPSHFGSGFSIFPTAPAGPGANVPPDVQRLFLSQLPPSDDPNSAYQRYRNFLSGAHVSGQVPQGVPLPTMYPELAQSWLHQAQTAAGGFPMFDPSQFPATMGGYQPQHWTWNQKLHTFVPLYGPNPPAQKVPEEGPTPPDVVRETGPGPTPPDRLLGDQGQQRQQQQRVRVVGQPQVGDSIGAFTDPETGQTVAGGVMTGPGMFRAENGQDYVLTSQGPMRNPRQGVQPTARQRGTTGAPATPPEAPAQTPADATAATPPASPPETAPTPPQAGTPPATGAGGDADEQLLFGPPPAAGAGRAPGAPAETQTIQPAPGTAPGATGAPGAGDAFGGPPRVPPATGAGAGQPGAPNEPLKERPTTTQKIQPSAEQYGQINTAIANDTGLQAYLMQQYHTLHPAPSTLLGDLTVQKAAANYQAQVKRDEETFKASLKQNATDQAQVRRAINARQQFQANVLDPVGVDAHGTPITPLSASPSPTGAEFSRIAEAGRHIEGGGAVGSTIRMLSSVAHMASSGGAGIVPGMPAEWATVEQMAQRPGVWGIAASRLLAALGMSVQIARALGETGRVNQQELNLLQNILIPSAADSEYRNRAKAQVVISTLDGLAKGLASGDANARLNAHNALVMGSSRVNPTATQHILATVPNVMIDVPGGQ